jgi:hypothetical protein
MYFYRVTVILKSKEETNPDDFFDDLYEKRIGKNKIVEVETSQVADDFEETSADDEGS